MMKQQKIQRLKMTRMRRQNFQLMRNRIVVRQVARQEEEEQWLQWLQQQQFAAALLLQQPELGPASTGKY